MFVKSFFTLQKIVNIYYNEVVIYIKGRVKMEKQMKKNYSISRVILTILTFILLCILFKNEDASFFKLNIILTAIAFAISFPGAMLSKKLIKIGDNIKNKPLKVLYYLVFLPSLAIIVFLGLYAIIYTIYLNFPETNSLQEALSKAIWVIFNMIASVIIVTIPYLQTIIVLILKKLKK